MMGFVGGCGSEGLGTERSRKWGWLHLSAVTWAPRERPKPSMALPCRRGRVPRVRCHAGIP